MQFIETKHQPVFLEKNQNLAEHLTVENSPVLFGCRTGICGTCLVVVEGDIPPASLEEKELLEVLAPQNPQARLACQIQLTNDIKIMACK
ncbi:MAG: 2Fe-2S iron-sulfur cluster-binding protein [Rivularia sp. (in: cyanobacteria)]